MKGNDILLSRFLFRSCPPYRFTFELLPEHGEEDGEIDWTGSLFQHLIDLLLLHVEATCGREGVIEEPWEPSAVSHIHLYCSIDIDI